MTYLGILNLESWLLDYGLVPLYILFNNLKYKITCYKLVTVVSKNCAYYKKNLKRYALYGIAIFCISIIKDFVDVFILYVLMLF